MTRVRGARFYYVRVVINVSGDRDYSGDLWVRWNCGRSGDDGESLLLDLPRAVPGLVVLPSARITIQCI